MRILVCLFILCTHSLLFGQQSAYFLFGGKEFEGVDIYDVIQDNENNYWFATDQGLIMHDGYSFEHIDCEDMKGGSVYGFVKSPDGTIYCHNLNHQVFAITGSKCSMIFEVPDKGIDLSLLATNGKELIVCSSREVYVVAKKGVKALSIDKNSYIVPPILLSDNAVLFHYIGTNKVVIWKNNKEELNTLHLKEGGFKFEDMILKFIQHKNKTYLIDTKNGMLFLLNEKTFELTHETTLDSKANRIYSAGNSLWIANNISGISVIKNELKNSMCPIESYSNYFISDVYNDTEGNILLSTFDNGVLVIPDIDVKDVDANFMDYSITKIFSDAVSNEIYFGTNDGKLLRFDQKIEEINSKGNKKIETLYKWSKHPYLFSDNNGFSSINIKTKGVQALGIGSLKDIQQVSENELILALNVGVYYLNYDETTKSFTYQGPLISNRAYNVCFEKSSNFTYASTSNGLFLIDAAKKFREIRYNKASISALALYSDGSKTYVSTRKNGVLICQNGKIISQFLPKLNDVNLTIFKLKIHNKKLYANTQIGLVIMNEKGTILKFLNKSSGLSTNKIIDFEIHQNELWVTHSRGVQRFNLNKINHKIYPPILAISSVVVNGKPVSASKKNNEYSSEFRKFKFVFRVNTLKNRENIRYHYKLEGINDHWYISPYENNEVTYNALGPGNYRFVVKAEDNGHYSLPQAYSFTISAPFYQRWWFNLSIGLALLLIMTLFYKRQLRIQKKKADQLNELNASRLTAIQSQMNPHFIFNSLNSIQDLVLKGDIDNSYTYITTFSNLVRRTLNYSDKDFIDFEQEIKLIELYLSLEKLRFKEDLVFSINTNDIEDIMIPPMLIQPFIENALVHGLLHKEGLKKLTINFSLTDVLICEISDNGIGREKARQIKNRQRANHESFAVNAIKRRFTILEEHFKGELGFKMEDIIVDTKVEGTKVTLRMPIKNKY